MGGATRVAVIGAGPAGLFLARLLGHGLPGTRIDVYERGRPGDGSGFGVALTERTLRDMTMWDPAVAARLGRVVRSLSAIELRLPGGSLRYDGFPMSTVSRTVLLALLVEEARRVGVRFHHGSDVQVSDLDADVIVLADGARSTNRSDRAVAFGTTVSSGAARYIWLGAAADVGDAATMFFVPTRYGPMAAHVYACGAGPSTVVVELDEQTWRRAGLDAMTRPGGSPGEIGADGLALLDDVFATRIGAPLVSNRSRWARFDVVTNRRWSDGNVVLVGDAAHTAHFTVASGTTMALADAAALAAALCEHDSVSAALAAYEQARKGPVARVQRVAEPSMRWWETYGSRLHLPPAEFGLHFISRSTAVGFRSLLRRCPARLAEAEAAYRAAAGSARTGTARHAVAEPLTVGALRLPNRLLHLVGTDVGRPDGSPPDGSDDGPGLRPAATLRPLPSDPVVDRWAPGMAGRLTARAGSPTLRVVAVAPPEPEATRTDWESALERVRALRVRGVDIVLLLPALAVPDWWERAVEFGGRIRAETAMVVAGCVPEDWAIDLCRDLSTDTWTERVHLALITGRLDLVAQWHGLAAAAATPR
ncbi:FAD-dependent monooxygenase [Micromonospora sp. KLBMP9576]|uniref:FAD-dependent monooxygenase n=1 Tax=Micromonospora sp. KLBMP9576 TaxID=3424769 RepID=UPI003D8C83AB